MKPKLILLSLFTIIIGFGFMSPEANVWAQTEQHCIDLVDYYPHSLITAGYSGSNTENCTDPWIGHGWRSCGSYFSYLYDFYARVGVRFDLPEGATRVISASASWSGMAVSGRWQIGWPSHNINFGTGNTATATVAQVNALPFPERLSYITLDLERRNLTESEANAGFIIDSFIVCYLGGAPLSEDEPDPPEYHRPFKSDAYGITQDRQMINNSGALVAFSQAPSSRVHAPEDGIITDITVVQKTDCDSLGLSSEVFGSGDCVVQELEKEDGNFMGAGYRISYLNFGSWLLDTNLANVGSALSGGWTDELRLRGWRQAQVITLSGDSGIWKIWVNNVTQFVTEGTIVTAGQCLGESIPLEIFNVSLSDNLSVPKNTTSLLGMLEFGTYQSRQGITFIETPNGISPSQLGRPNGIEPTGNCHVPTHPEDGGITERFSGCLADIDLANRGSWHISGASWDDRGGIIIDRNGYIESIINLNPDREPVVMVSWRWDTSDNSQINIAETSHTFPRKQGFHYQLDEVMLPVNLEPNVSDMFYTLKVQAPATHKIEIEYICIYNQLDENFEAVVGTPNWCYFENWNFLKGTEHWYPINAGTTDIVELPQGGLIVPSYASIGQVAILVSPDDDPQDFHLEIRWSLVDLQMNATQLKDIEIDIQIEKYIIDRETLDYVTIGTYSVEDIINGQVITRFTITTQPQVVHTGNIRVRPIIRNAPATTQGIQITMMCLTSDHWDTVTLWPNETRIRLNEQCGVIGEPVGASENFGIWIGYHWKQLERFFTCDLMVFLNQMLNRLLDFFDSVKMFFRWLMVVFQMTLRWFSTDILYWLNGHLSNIAGGNVTFIEVQSGGKSCNNLFCALDSLFGGVSQIFQALAELLTSVLDKALVPIINLLLQLVGDTFNFIRDLAQRIIDLIFAGIGLAVTLVGVLFGLLWKLFIDFLSTEPIHIPLLPYCNVDPASSPACRFFWVAEHTVFSGPGAVIIPIFSGYIAIMITLTVIKDLKKAITESGGLI